MILEQNVPLQPYNTFGIAARAETLVRIRSQDDIRQFLADPLWGRQPVFVLGGGSNVVLTGDVAPVVLKMEIQGMRLLEERDDAWILEAGAGVPWHELVAWSLDQGVPGLENLALIPGTVGAAPVQNIGAYGVELQDRFDALDAIDLDIFQGEFVAIMGPSGCGKSTLLNMIGMLDSPSSGSYRFGDTEIAGLPEPRLAGIRKTHLGFIFQSFNLIDELSVAENIELALLYHAMPAAEHLLKGLFVALALHAGIWASADPSARWGTLAAIDGIAMAGLVVSLGWAAMRTAPGRNRPLAHLMFLLLKHGAMVRGGLVGGMVAGASADIFGAPAVGAGGGAGPGPAGGHRRDHLRRGGPGPAGPFAADR